MVVGYRCISSVPFCTQSSWSISQNTEVCCLSRAVTSATSPRSIWRQILLPPTNILHQLNSWGASCDTGAMELLYKCVCVLFSSTSGGGRCWTKQTTKNSFKLLVKYLAAQDLRDKRKHARHNYRHPLKTFIVDVLLFAFVCTLLIHSLVWPLVRLHSTPSLTTTTTG